jgi:hypothetical protein
MSKPVRLAREARAELHEAARRYGEQRPELRLEFLAAVDETMERLVRLAKHLGSASCDHAGAAVPERRRLPRAHTRNQLERIDHLTIAQDPGIRDDRLDFLVCEYRCIPPLGILIGDGAELALVEHARRLLDHVGELRIPEHRRDDSVDVVDGPLGEIALSVSAQLVEQVDQVARVAALVVGVGNAVWASHRGELVPLAPTPAKVTDLALALNGTVITAGDDGEIHELRDGQSVRRLGSPVRWIRWSPDGHRVAALATLGNVSVWDVSGRVVREIPKPSFAGGNIAFSNDGKWLARERWCRGLDGPGVPGDAR